MRGDPYAYVVPGTSRITRGKSPKVTVQMGVVRYPGKLSSSIFDGIEGVTLRFLGVQDAKAGPADLYLLEVLGGPQCCASVQCVLIYTVEGNEQKRRLFWRLARAEPRNV